MAADKMTETAADEKALRAKEMTETAAVETWLLAKMIERIADGKWLLAK